MRIIGGEFKRMQLIAPEGTETTRPITDRVKESLFDRLTNMGLVDDGYVLDLFAGSGGMGIEALSRGSDHCTFVEMHHKVTPILEKNIASIGLEGYSTTIKADALSCGWLNMVMYKPVKVVFCDPPYRLCENEKDWQAVANMIQQTASVMEAGGLLVLRTHTRANVKAVEGFIEPTRFELGSMTLHFYWKPREGGE